MVHGLQGQKGNIFVFSFFHASITMGIGGGGGGG